MRISTLPASLLLTTLVVLIPFSMPLCAQADEATIKIEASDLINTRTSNEPQFQPGTI